MTVSAVGFDLDYTLAIPTRDRAALLDDAAGAVDAPPLDRDAYLDAHRRHLANETRAPIFADLLDGRADPPPDDPSPDELAAAYRRAINGALVPVAGVATLLETLRGRYRIGLLTNGPAAAQRSKLAALGLDDAFDAVVIAGDLGVGKPDGRAFEALLRRLNASPDEAAYVGDEVEADVRGAAAAGLRTVQVCSPGGPAPDTRADARVERDALARALPAVLDSLGDGSSARRRRP